MVGNTKILRLKCSTNFTHQDKADKVMRTVNIKYRIAFRQLILVKISNELVLDHVSCIKL